LAQHSLLCVPVRKNGGIFTRFQLSAVLADGGAGFSHSFGNLSGLDYAQFAMMPGQTPAHEAFNFISVKH
jgi:hypothetical protein